MQVDARIDINSLSGNWSDSAGNSGTFVFNGNAGGAARPAPTVPGAVIAVGSLPSTAITNNSITSTQIQNNSITSLSTSNEPGVAFDTITTPVVLAAGPTSVMSTSMRVPANGFVKIEVTGNWLNTAGVDSADCQLQKGAAVAISTTQPRFHLRDRSADGQFDSFSAHRIVSVSAADNPQLNSLGQSFRLVCDLTAGTISIDDAIISATYYASSYEPFGVILPLDTTPPPPQQ